VRKKWNGSLRPPRLAETQVGEAIFTKSLEKRFSSDLAAYSMGDFRQSRRLFSAAKMRKCMVAKKIFNVERINDFVRRSFDFKWHGTENLRSTFHPEISDGKLSEMLAAGRPAIW
jgi:hypothetical protein